MLACSDNPLVVTNDNPSVAHLLQGCTLQSGLGVAVQISGFVNLTIRNSFIGAVSVTALRWSTTSPAYLTIEDCTWAPAASSASPALLVGGLTQATGINYRTTSQVLAIRRTAIVLPTGISFLSIPTQQTSAISTTTPFNVQIVNSTIEGSGWAQFISIAASIQDSVFLFSNATVSWSLPQTLPLSSISSFDWISVPTTMSTNCTWKLYRSNMSVVRPTTLPMTYSSTMLAIPVTLLGLTPSYPSVSSATVIVQETSLLLQGGLLTYPYGTLTLLRCYVMSLSKIIVVDSLLLVNHTLTPSSSSRWTTVVALRLACTEKCSAFNVSGNNVSLWGSAVPWYSCSYNSNYVIVQLLQLQSPLSMLTTAMIANNQINAVQNVTTSNTYYCGYLRLISFQLFSLSLSLASLQQSTVSILVQDNQFSALYNWPTTSSGYSTAIPVAFAALTSNCVGSITNCSGVVRRNSINVTQVGNVNNPYQSVDVSLVTMQDYYLGGTSNISNNVMCVTSSVASLLAASTIPTSPDGIVSHVSDVIAVWRAANEQATMAAATMCGLATTNLGSAPAWSVCGNTASVVSSAASAYIVGSNAQSSSFYSSIVSSNTIVAWGAQLSPAEMLKPPQLSTLNIAVVTSGSLYGNVQITGNMIACKSSFPINVRLLASSAYVNNNGNTGNTLPAVMASNTIDVIGYITGSSSISTTVTFADTLYMYAPIVITRNFLRCLSSGSVNTQASIISTVYLYSSSFSLFARNNLMTILEDRQWQSDSSLANLGWLAASAIRGEYYGSIANCSTPGDSALTSVCNNTLLVATSNFVFPNTSTTSSQYYVYSYRTISMNMLQSAYASSANTQILITDNWAVINSTNTNITKGVVVSQQQYYFSGTVSLTIAWLSSTSANSASGSTIRIRNNLGYIVGDENPISTATMSGSGNTPLIVVQVQRTMSISVCSSVSTSSSNSVASRSAGLITQNSFIAFVPSAAQPAPRVGTRSSQAPSPLDCMGSVLSSPSVLKWTNTTVTAPWLLVCDNHVFSTALPFLTTINFVASTSLYASLSPAYPYELYVVGNRIVASGLSNPSMTSLTCAGPSVSIYDNDYSSSSSQTVMPLLAVGDNSLMGANMSVGVSATILNSLYSQVYDYTSAMSLQRNGSTYKICNNTLTSTTRANFSSELLSSNITALSNARSCPHLDNTTRVVVCNNTVVLTNHTGAVGFQWAQQLYQYYSDQSGAASTTTPSASRWMDSLLVMNNDAYVFGASVLSACGIGTISGDQRYVNSIVTRNTLQTSNLASTVARAVSDSSQWQAYGSGGNGINVQLVSSVSVTAYGRPIVVEQNIVQLSSINGSVQQLVASFGSFCDQSVQALSAIGGGGLVHICGNVFSVVHGSEGFNTSFITNAGYSVVGKTFQAMVISYFYMSTPYSMTGAFFTNTSNAQLVSVNNNSMVGVVPTDGYTSISAYLCSYLSVSISTVGVTTNASSTSRQYSASVATNVLDVAFLLNFSSMNPSVSYYLSSTSITTALMYQFSGNFYDNGNNYASSSNVTLISIQQDFSRNSLAARLVTATGSAVTPLSTYGGTFMMGVLLYSNAQTTIYSQYSFVIQRSIEISVHQNFVYAAAPSAQVWSYFSSIQAYLVSYTSTNFYTYLNATSTFNLLADNNTLILDTSSALQPTTASSTADAYFYSSFRVMLLSSTYVYSYSPYGSTLSQNQPVNAVLLNLERNVIKVQLNADSSTLVASVGASFVGTLNYGTSSNPLYYQFTTDAVVAGNSLQLQGSMQILSVSGVSYVSGNFSRGTGTLDISNNAIDINVTNVSDSFYASVLSQASAMVETMQISSNTITFVSSTTTTFGSFVAAACSQTQLVGLAERTGTGQLRVCGNTMRVWPMQGVLPQQLQINVVQYIQLQGLYFPVNTSTQLLTIEQNTFSGVIVVSPSAATEQNQWVISTVASLSCSFSYYNNYYIQFATPPITTIVYTNNTANIIHQITGNYSNPSTPSGTALSIAGIASMSMNYNTYQVSAAYWVPFTALSMNVSRNTMNISAFASNGSVPPPLIISNDDSGGGGDDEVSSLLLSSQASPLLGSLEASLIGSISASFYDYMSGYYPVGVNPQIVWMNVSVQSNNISVNATSSNAAMGLSAPFLASINVGMVQDVSFTSYSYTFLTTIGVNISGVSAAHCLHMAVEGNHMNAALSGGGATFAASSLLAMGSSGAISRSSLQLSVIQSFSTSFSPGTSQVEEHNSASGSNEIHSLLMSELATDSSSSSSEIITFPTGGPLAALTLQDNTMNVTVVASPTGATATLSSSLSPPLFSCISLNIARELFPSTETTSEDIHYGDYVLDVVRNTISITGTAGAPVSQHLEVFTISSLGGSFQNGTASRANISDNNVSTTHSLVTSAVVWSYSPYSAVTTQETVEGSMLAAIVNQLPSLVVFTELCIVNNSLSLLSSSLSFSQQPAFKQQRLAAEVIPFCGLSGAPMGLNAVQISRNTVKHNNSIPAATATGGDAGNTEHTILRSASLLTPTSSTTVTSRSFAFPPIAFVVVGNSISGQLDSSIIAGSSAASGNVTNASTRGVALSITQDVTLTLSTSSTTHALRAFVSGNQVNVSLNLSSAMIQDDQSSLTNNSANISVSIARTLSSFIASTSDDVARIADLYVISSSQNIVVVNLTTSTNAIGGNAPLNVSIVESIQSDLAVYGGNNDNSGDSGGVEAEEDALSSSTTTTRQEGRRFDAAASSTPSVASSDAIVTHLFQQNTVTLTHVHNYSLSSAAMNANTSSSPLLAMSASVVNTMLLSSLSAPSFSGYNPEGNLLTPLVVFGNSNYITLNSSSFSSHTVPTSSLTSSPLWVSINATTVQTFMDQSAYNTSIVLQSNVVNVTLNHSSISSNSVPSALANVSIATVGAVLLMPPYGYAAAKFSILNMTLNKIAANITASATPQQHQEGALYGAMVSICGGFTLSGYVSSGSPAQLLFNQNSIVVNMSDAASTPAANTAAGGSAIRVQVCAACSIPSSPLIGTSQMTMTSNAIVLSNRRSNTNAGWTEEIAATVCYRCSMYLGIMSLVPATPRPTLLTILSNNVTVVLLPFSSASTTLVSSSASVSATVCRGCEVVITDAGALSDSSDDFPWSPIRFLASSNLIRISAVAPSPGVNSLPVLLTSISATVVEISRISGEYQNMSLFSDLRYLGICVIGGNSVILEGPVASSLSTTATAGDSAAALLVSVALLRVNGEGDADAANEPAPTVASIRFSVTSNTIDCWNFAATTITPLGAAAAGSVVTTIVLASIRDPISSSGGAAAVQIFRNLVAIKSPALPIKSSSSWSSSSTITFAALQLVKAIPYFVGESMSDMFQRTRFAVCMSDFVNIPASSNNFTLAILSLSPAMPSCISETPTTPSNNKTSLLIARVQSNRVLSFANSTTSAAVSWSLLELTSTGQAVQVSQQSPPQSPSPTFNPPSSTFAPQSPAAALHRQMRPMQHDEALAVKQQRRTHATQSTTTTTLEVFASHWLVYTSNISITANTTDPNMTSLVANVSLIPSSTFAYAISSNNGNSRSGGSGGTGAFSQIDVVHVNTTTPLLGACVVAANQWSLPSTTSSSPSSSTSGGVSYFSWERASVTVGGKSVMGDVVLESGSLESASMQTSTGEWELLVQDGSTIGGVVLVGNGAAFASGSFVNINVTSGCTMLGLSPLSGLDCANSLFCIAQNSAILGKLEMTVDSPTVASTVPSQPLLTVAQGATVTNMNLIGVNISLSSSTTSPLPLRPLIHAHSNSWLNNVAMSLFNLTSSQHKCLLAAESLTNLTNVSLTMESSRVTNLEQIIVFNQSVALSSVVVAILDSSLVATTATTAAASAATAANTLSAVLLVPAPIQQINGDIPTVAATAPPSLVPWWCPLKNSSITLDNTHLVGFAYGASFGVVTTTSSSAASTSTFALTQSNLVINTACMSWDAAIAGSSSNNNTRGVFSRAAFSPPSSWWPVYAPLCYSPSRINGDIPTVAATAPPSVVPWWCPFKNSSIILDNTHLVGFAYGASFGVVSTTSTSSSTSTPTVVLTQSNLVINSACMSWDAAAAMAGNSNNNTRGVFSRAAFSPPSSWWPVYAPLCYSPSRPQVVCPCVVPGGDTTTSSASLSITESNNWTETTSVSRVTMSHTRTVPMLPPGVLPPHCPNLLSLSDDVESNALSAGPVSVAFALPPASISMLTLPVGATVPSTYVSWSSAPQSQSSGGPTSSVGQPGGFKTVDPTQIACMVATPITINCTLPCWRNCAVDVCVVVLCTAESELRRTYEFRWTAWGLQNGRHHADRVHGRHANHDQLHAAAVSFCKPVTEQ
ncbi:Hypothetical protein, putative [Bodo saltans]|uniref:Uncharacterized protein n=1 Tax=Bodo saltans TaxID=75058 RepID=A0A0S4JA99_BODSA|nr:Hypothetical protein, putative [Bodo saltans]|eukprot:CUG88420.1 Hypothetical protein, putative [Bodo saltans]